MNLSLGPLSGHCALGKSKQRLISLNGYAATTEAAKRPPFAPPPGVRVTFAIAREGYEVIPEVRQFFEQ